MPIHFCLPPRRVVHPILVCVWNNATTLPLLLLLLYGACASHRHSILVHGFYNAFMLSVAYQTATLPSISPHIFLYLSSSCCCVYCASLPSLFPPLRTFLSPSLSTITESPKPHSSTTITTTIKKNNNLLLIQVTYSCDSWALTYARESFTCSCSWQQLVQ